MTDRQLALTSIVLSIIALIAIGVDFWHHA